MLTANPGTTYNGSQLFNTYAWCVDVFDNIYLGGDSIVYNLQPLNVPNAGEIAKVAMWGDEQLAKGPNELISAAVQAEIWELEYNVTVSAATDPWDNDVTSELETEVTAINDMFSDPLSPGAGPDYLLAGNFVGGGRAQSLFTPVPEPAGMGLLCVGLLAMLGIRRIGRPG